MDNKIIVFVVIGISEDKTKVGTFGIYFSAENADEQRDLMAERYPEDMFYVRETSFRDAPKV